MQYPPSDFSPKAAQILGVRQTPVKGRPLSPAPSAAPWARSSPMSFTRNDLHVTQVNASAETGCPRRYGGVCAGAPLIARSTARPAAGVS